MYPTASMLKQSSTASEILVRWPQQDNRCNHHFDAVPMNHLRNVQGVQDGSTRGDPAGKVLKDVVSRVAPERIDRTGSLLASKLV